jgi:hypothetical protein
VAANKSTKVSISLPQVQIKIHRGAVSQNSNPKSLQTTRNC